MKTVQYNEMGKGMERTIGMIVKEKIGTMVCIIDATGMADNTLCLSDMVTTTQLGVLEMIEESGIENLIWPGPYGFGAAELKGLWTSLELIEDGKNYAKFRVIKRR